LPEQCLISSSRRRPLVSSSPIEPRRLVRDFTRSAPSPDGRVGAVVRLGHNERTIPLPDGVVREIFSQISAEELTALPELGRLAAKIAKFIGVDSGQIVLCHGADAGIASVFDAYIDPGDEIVRPAITYHRYAELAELHGAVEVCVGLDANVHLDREHLMSSVHSGTRLVIVVNPDSPTGSVLSIAQLTALVERARRHDALVLVDEAYHHFCDVTALPLLKRYHNVVIARSFSKAFGIAGVRVGYLVANPAVAAQLRKVKLRHEVSAVSARVAEYLLEHREIMEDYVASVVASREPLAAALSEFGFHMVPTASAGALVRVPDDINATSLAAATLAHGYEIAGGLPSPLHRYIRVTLGPWNQMLGFLSALRASTASLQTPSAQTTPTQAS
jgi:histidinol-phosphate aminotransferase